MTKTEYKKSNTQKRLKKKHYRSIKYNGLAMHRKAIAYGV